MERRSSGLPPAMDRRTFLKLGGAGIAGAAVLAATDSSPLYAQAGSRVQSDVQAAARRYKVPAGLLLAMGHVNTAWEMPPPEASAFEELPPRLGDCHARGAYGFMQLMQNPADDSLGEAARLTGLSEAKLKADRASNILGGAAVVARLKGRPTPGDINAYYDAVAEYGRSPQYANDVFELLSEGASRTTSGRERVTLEAQEEASTRALRTTQAAGQYPRATWWGNNGNVNSDGDGRGNYTDANRPRYYTWNGSRGAAPIKRIIIHVGQGPYSSILNWFRSSGNNISSAHYTVGRDGRIGQSVREGDIGWHAGWWDYNRTSIGIEHAGYVSNPGYWFTDAMYRSSAKLSAYLCRKYGIPADRRFIIGHHQVPGCSGAGGGVGCHTDPGRGWNWEKYMRYVRAYKNR